MFSPEDAAKAMTDFGESMLQGNGADPSMHELLLAATGKSGSSKPRAAIADGAQDEEEQAAATEKEDEEDEEEWGADQYTSEGQRDIERKQPTPDKKWCDQSALNKAERAFRKMLTSESRR